MPNRYLFIRDAYVCVFCIQGVCRGHLTKNFYHHDPEQCPVYENGLTIKPNQKRVVLRRTLTSFCYRLHSFCYRVIPETVSVFQPLIMTFRFPIHGLGQTCVFFGCFNTTPCRGFVPKICFTSFFPRFS